jgi:hypothetical protein
MWYVAGSNQEDYLVHGYAESEDGSIGWNNHAVFAPPEMRIRQRGDAFDAIFARASVRQGTHTAGRDRVVVVQSKDTSGCACRLEPADPDYDG